MTLLVLGVLLGWAIEWLFVTFYRGPMKSKDPSNLEGAADKLLKCKQALLQRDRQISELELEVAGLSPLHRGESKVASDTHINSPTGNDDSPVVDLKAVSGIGPKIAGLLKQAGIDDCKKLAQMTPDGLKEILAAAGPNYAMADVSTWAKQAQLLISGDQAGLKIIQNTLKT